ncbi:hypothetical protein F511_47274 [Dorcoceras hygrometricum]|uniref:Uncharacterized protein n=1 Tax=Dorcoceras hygrometricum TaxID=472368 RepID=A0A2Z6ZSI2_9LAMI|nr:hypothetical protein F511_47274 [Dorcoceras hygrometricum]
MRAATRNVAHHAIHHRALAARWIAAGRALASRLRRDASVLVARLDRRVGRCFAGRAAMRCCSLRAGGATFDGSPLRIMALLHALAVRLPHERRPNVTQEACCCWAMSAAVGAAVRRAWHDAARGCRARLPCEDFWWLRRRPAAAPTKLRRCRDG